MSNPCTFKLQEILERLAGETWPGIPVKPELSTGATDGLFLCNAGIPVLEVSSWFSRTADVRAHGLDEKNRHRRISCQNGVLVPDAQDPQPTLIIA